MVILNSIWSDLKLNAGRSLNDIVSHNSYKYLRKQNGNLVYLRNSGYKSKTVYVAKQKAMQFIEQQANNLIPKYKRYLDYQNRQFVLQQQESELLKLIDKGEKVDSGLGSIFTENGYEITAKDKYGTKIPESIMLYYDTDSEITVEDTYMSSTTCKMTSRQFKTKTVCFFDIVARASVQSSKNIVLTQVQGRDFTRKELISGGDLAFSVSGKILSDDIGVYPDSSVKKFIQIMQYGGIVNVNHYLFKQFNIDKILIKDFNLGVPECKNEQPYSFSCVAVEPDESVAISSDTIGVLNHEISLSPSNKWVKLILDSKLATIASNAITNNVSNTIATGFDKLVPNI